MKILRVGDPHVKVSNLKDSEKLIEFIIKTAKEHQVNSVEILGDLFHTHAIKRLEVENFWIWAFDKFNQEQICLIVLCGNHDLPGSKELENSVNALNVFKPKTGEDCLRIIVDEPMILRGNIAYIPYMSDKNKFIDEAKQLYDQGATKTLIAHQTFATAKYETGFFAPEGIELDLVCQDRIISGHIHTSQEIGKCLCVGATLWEKMSDANHPKYIWIFEHDNENGSILSQQPISIEKVVTPIFKLVIKEGDPEPQLAPNARNYLEFQGKTAWIKKMTKKYRGKAGIKGIPTDRKLTVVAKQNKYNINEYLNTVFEPIIGVSKQDITDYLKELRG